jgi:hypothetical protein
MNNLSQEQLDAKQAFLNRQLERTLAQYEKASQNERKAIVSHIDSFLPAQSNESRIFWLKLRYKLETLNDENTSK